VLCFIEERFGVPTLDKLWRAMLDAQRGQYAGIQDLFEKTLGQPLSQLEADWRRFYNLDGPVMAGAAGGTGASPSAKLMSAVSLCQSGQYDQALDTLDNLLDVNGATLSSYEWGQAYLLAGYAYDRKGERGRAMERYTLAGTLTEPRNGPVALWAEKGLVSPLTTAPFASVQGMTTGRVTTTTTVPMLPEDHFANVDATTRARLAEQHLQTLQAAPAGEEGLRAIDALGLLRETRAVPHLIRFLEDQRDVRASWFSARALGRIGDRAAIPALIGSLAHPTSRDMQRESLDALARITGQQFSTQEEWRRWLAANPQVQGR
ncbi:MAG: HEAT repeat domain-containing protein, partial [Planctomycetes bacterium]|nr:HEAT repeat domain-containing protein [Planctomycetota bacterium]